MYRFKYSLDDKYYALSKISLHFVEKGKASFERRELKEQLKEIAPNLNLQENEIGDFIIELCRQELSCLHFFLVKIIWSVI